MESEPTISERWNNRALLALLWPLVIEQLLAVTMGVADTIMVAGEGEYAVSGVNIVDNINNLLIIAVTAMCTGGAVVVSQYIGRRDHTNSRLAAKQLLYIVTFLSLVLMSVALLFRRPIIGLIYGKIENDVMNAATVYFLFTSLSYPFLAIQNANAALFRSLGNSMIPMRVALLANILKIGFNALFIFVFKMGIAGAALSTLICRMITALITTIMHTRNHTSPVSLSGLFDIRLIRPMIRNILNVGIPSSVENSMFQMGRLMTQRIYTSFGTSAIAANAIAGVMNNFTFMPGMACGFAMLTIVGQCVGAGDYDEAIKQVNKIMKIVSITLFVISATIFIFMDPLAGLFNLSPQAHELAKTFLRVQCFNMAFGYATSSVLPSALRASGDARYVMLVAAISMWTVRVSAAYLLTFVLGLGPVGVWFAMGGDFVVRSIFYYARWKGGKWKEKRVLSD